MSILLLCQTDQLPCQTAPFLRDAGFMVIEAGSTAEAIQQAQAHSIDAAIVEPALSSPNELQLVREIRQQNLWFPLIVISRCERWAHISDLLTAGADEYLDESFASGTLLDKLEKLLRNRHLRQPNELRLKADFGTIRVHNLGQQVFINDSPAQVSAYDYLTLKCIAQNLGENGLSRQTLLSQQAQRGCGVNLAESAEYLLQRIHP